MGTALDDIAEMAEAAAQLPPAVEAHATQRAAHDPTWEVLPDADPLLPLAACTLQPATYVHTATACPLLPTVGLVGLVPQARMQEAAEREEARRALAVKKEVRLRRPR